MILQKTARAKDLADRLEAFMEEEIYPNEERFYRESEDGGPWQVQPVIEELKPKAKAAGRRPRRPAPPTPD
ncbi:MAG: hypothetical protein KC464_03935 [Myxococcales bacterium]|nr:hypothetical protein [Myxococcales bacterium]